MKKFNINNSVKVKLTEKGRTIYYNRDVELNKFYGKEVIKPRLPKEDKDGYFQIQLWELMRLYGPHMFNGCEQPFETEIILGDPI